MAADILLRIGMRERLYRPCIELTARAAALLVLLCVIEACTGPGLEPPGDQNAGAGTGGAHDGGAAAEGGSAGAGGSGGLGVSGSGGSAGSGGFPPTGGVGGDGDGDGSDAGEADMDASVDDEDGGVDPTND